MGNIKRISIALLCAALILGISGCAGWFGKKQEKTAPELVEMGDAQFQNEKYSKAIKTYERLRDWYPYSPHIKTAELRIADSHYRLGEYEQALAAYEHYERLHPGDPSIPYVIYQMGMCHFKRMRSIDRTQVPTQNALQEFTRLRSRFPESKYSQEAAPKVKECKKHLAGHEFYVGQFYFKSEHYLAALERFENVVKKYPEVEGYSRKAGDHIKQCRKYLAEMEEETGEDVTRRPTESRETGRLPFTDMED
ncbi:MAG: outer membrane protein assembly factor BamD [Desulfobacterales bacterium]|nr:outer membrane protein assembly factor BamD [Desulfobacterales bacterium]